MRAPNIRQQLVHARANGVKDDGLTGKQVPYKSITGLGHQVNSAGDIRFGGPYDVTDHESWEDAYKDGRPMSDPGEGREWDWGAITSGAYGRGGKFDDDHLGDLFDFLYGDKDGENPEATQNNSRPTAPVDPRRILLQKLMGR